MSSRAGAALVVALALLLGRTPIASAHAELAGSDPPIDGVVADPPSVVTLWFTERPELQFSQVQVLDASARDADRKDLRPDPTDPTILRVSVGTLDKGTFTVVWKALSAVDGHVTSGAYAFTVGLDTVPTGLAIVQEAAAPVRWEQVAIRPFIYLGLAGATAGFPFVWWLLLPVVAGIPPRNRELRVQRIALLSFAAALFGLVAFLVDLIAEAAISLDRPFLAVIGQPALSFVFSSRFGSLWLIKMELLIALAVMSFLLYRGPQRWPILGLGTLLGGGLLFTYALGTHPAAAPGAPPMAIGIQWVHLVAVSVWIGGLIYLFLPAWLLTHGQSSREEAGLAARLIPRFSVMASICVASLILSGTYAGWLLVGSFGALPGTFYGQTLLVKIALVAVVLLVGATNLLVLSPRLREAASRPDEAAELVRRLRVSVGGEILLAATVFIATALLSSVQTGRQQAVANGIAAKTTTGDVIGVLRVQPGAAGTNRFQLSLFDRTGNALSNVEKVELRFTSRARDLGESALSTTARPEGSFSAQGGVLVTPGPWHIEAVVRRLGLDDARPAFDFTIGPALPPGSLAFAADQVEGNVVLGAELLVAGLFLALGVWLLRPRSTRLLLPPAFGGMVIGVIVGATSLAALAATLRNPVAPTQASLDRGGAIYAERCAVCHGDSGRGDGPAAFGLNPRPADLRVHLAAGHTDAQLFDWVSNGYPSSAMPAFKSDLSEEDRWNVLNYLRGSFGPGVPAVP